MDRLLGLLEELRAVISEEYADELTSDLKDIEKRADAALSQAASVEDNTPESEFAPETFVKKFPGFQVWQVPIHNENRDAWYGPVTGVDRLKHESPAFEKGMKRVAGGKSGTLTHKAMKEPKAEWVLYTSKAGPVLRWKILGQHKKKGKKPDLSVLWLFYLRKGGG